MAIRNPRPNIIFLQAEDTGRHQHCYGDPAAHTPNIDRLAAEGCRFTHAFSTAPVCAPSRSTMVMGQHSNKVGSHHMRSALLNPPPLFTHALREAGYFVNWANKTDFNFEPPADFADARKDWIADLEAGRFPGPDRGDRPWFLYFNFSMTHESGMWPPGADPDRAFDEHVPEPGMPDEDHAGLPVPPYLPDTPITRCALRRYYRTLRRQDDQIGRVLRALDTHGLARSTVVIYLADHGRGMPREKRWLYEAGIHLPLIIRAPGLVPPGSVREDLVSWVDIAPTLHALAGSDIPERYDGRVLIDTPSAAAGPEPTFVFAARDRMDESFDRLRAARSRRFLYIRNDFPQLPWAQRLKYMETICVMRELRELHARGRLAPPADALMHDRKPDEELFDTAADPHCLHNLADDPRFAATLQDHRRAVADWCERINDRGMVTERELIEQGVVSNRLDEEYRPRIAPLPDRLRRDGRFDTVLEQPR